MSSSIWTRCAGDSEIRTLRLQPWRAIEAQHQVSTRKLVSSAAEQAVLEDLIDGAKPPMHASARTPPVPPQHYLLTTPFRYPPLRNGSRFGTRHEPGIWYGAETHETVFADVAYYRLVFLEGTRADLGSVTTQLTVFRVTARSAQGIDLTAAPFNAHRRAISSPSRYAATHALGAAMRAAGVELFRYTSARAPRSKDGTVGVNVGAFTPDVFGRSKPRDLETWQCTATRALVEVAKRDYSAQRPRAVHAFAREAFLVEGVLPAPAV